MPYCAKCGVEVKPGKSFCANCGAQIVERVKEQDRISEDNAILQGTMHAQQSKKTSKKGKAWKAIKIAAISFAALITILFLIGVAIGVTGGMPVYPGATEFNYQGLTIEEMLSSVEQDMPAGWSAKMYQTTAQIDTVMEWYRNNMSGWETEMDEFFNVASDMDIGYLCFTKNADAAFAISMDITVDAVENHYLIIMTGPAKDIQDIISGTF